MLSLIRISFFTFLLIIILAYNSIDLAFAFKPIPINNKIQINITRHSPDSYISGVVIGLPRQECENYKVVMYVLTDTWNLYPYTTKEDRFAHSFLTASCFWEIRTSTRLPLTTQVAFLLVDKQLEIPHQLFDLSQIDYLSIYANEWLEISRVMQAEPLRGQIGFSKKWESGWLDLWRSTDFKKGDSLRLNIGGTAKRIVVRLLSEGVDPNSPIGIINGIIEVPKNRIFEVELKKDYSRVVQISVHGGNAPWGIFSLGEMNGPASLLYADRVDRIPNVDRGSASITSLKDGEKVTTPEYIEGICNNISEGIYLWIIVRPILTQNYHPQSSQADSGPISNGCDGFWEGVAYIGESRERNINEQFEILLAGANRKGSIEMQNYLIKANQTHRWSGISKLPQGTKIFQKITVIRR